jgi:hypothetical protein
MGLSRCEITQHSFGLYLMARANPFAQTPS